MRAFSRHVTDKRKSLAVRRKSHRSVYVLDLGLGARRRTVERALLKIGGSRPVGTVVEEVERLAIRREDDAAALGAERRKPSVLSRGGIPHPNTGRAAVLLHGVGQQFAVAAKRDAARGVAAARDLHRDIHELHQQKK